MFAVVYIPFCIVAVLYFFLKNLPFFFPGKLQAATGTLFLIILSGALKAQPGQDTLFRPGTVFSQPKKYPLFSYNPNHQTDLNDLLGKLVSKKSAGHRDTVQMHIPGKVRLSAIPAVGYTLQTGFTGIFSGNLAWYTNAMPKTNISTIVTSISYTQYNQIILPLQVNIWSKNGKYNFQADDRFLKYPSYTYGLGGNTMVDSGYLIDYDYLRLHQSVSRKIGKDLYLGLGYDYDHFWNIREIDPDTSLKPTDFEVYGLTKNVTSSGLSLSILYDSRRNSLNPDQGTLFNLAFRPRFTFLGSDQNWQSLTLDYRSYFKFPARSRNILAFWSYDWFTLGGSPPYLLLPSTGWDPQSNTGRGYIQGRFRSTNMLYVESEYRFGITPNGLLGGVFFVNAESFSEKVTNKFQYVAPGYGFGIRLKLNKFSGSNLCIDYGFGQNGSGGIAVNLGEVF